jgi:4-alpha-glucanotransferase
MKTDVHWSKIGLHSHHGVLIPISALRTDRSCGIGEFLDLIPMIDWCASLNMDVIQILPINDSGNDPSPYNALSACALDPIYLSLADLPGAAIDRDIFSSLTRLPRIDHRTVRSEKLKVLRKYFEEHLRKQETEEFMRKNRWVQTYALFKAYKDEYGETSWEEWPEEAKAPTPFGYVDKREAVAFYCFVQLLCFEQMRKVKAYASSKNILIKGDIPILLSPDSADVWSERRLFDLSLAAGAPPDFYNPKGQYWGFPLFRWQVMRDAHFVWWKERLDVAAEIFHLYRLDHVVGFFRIWAIPKGKKPTEGHFVPHNLALWPNQGREILEMMIDSSPLLPVAEDLGTIPDFVRPILKKLGVCKTCVMRWERYWHGDRSYIPFDRYEPLSLTTVSTHDSEPLVIWWKNHPDEAALMAQLKGWHYTPILTFEQHLSLLRDSHHTASYFHINLLQETLSLFPELRWPNLNDERINIPGTTLPTNWTYRFRPTVEEIVSHQGLREAFRTILAK